MTTTFPRSTPSALHVDATGIAALVTALESTPDVEPHSLMLLRGGTVVAEAWWSPYAPDRPHLLYSLSKSFTAAAVGIARREGLLDLDDTVLSYFPELDAEVTDERSRRIRVRHLLAMASGHREETLQRARDIDPGNVVRGFLLLPPDEEPGTVFAYNQPCTYTLGEVVRRVSGGSLLDYLRPRLFAPLGIDDFAWRRDDGGREFGFSGGYTTTASIAALGQLYLQRGVWQGERILDEDWVDLATSPQVANPNEANPDWQQGYGFQFWMARHGLRGDGAYGQYCIVLPEHDVVLAMTGQTVDMQAVLDAVWTHLLPALDRPGSASADEDLSALLTSRTLAPLALPSRGSTGLDELGSVGRLTPGAVSVDGLEAVLLDQDASGRPVLTLVDTSGGGAERSVSVPVGDGAWAVSGALAASGVRIGDAFDMAVRFIETPHLLGLRLEPAAGTFEARWASEPLHDGVADLHRPAD